MPHPSPEHITSMPFLSPGTVLSCPDCGMGLYLLVKKVTRDSSFKDAVKPMANVPEYARSSSAKKCPFCRTGEWWYPSGAVHTLQHGWVA
jgi:hypothetical protein